MLTFKANSYYKDYWVKIPILIRDKTTLKSPKKLHLSFVHNIMFKRDDLEAN